MRNEAILMFQKIGVLAMVPVLVAAAPAYAEWHGNAHIENVEVTGSYLTDDTSEAGLKKAREEAHKDALRLATEKAGVFVQSYSKTHNQVLTEDEIQSISGNILAVQNESYATSKTDDGYTLVTCHLTAYIQLDQVDLNQAIQQINIEGENRELKAVIEGLKHSQGKAGELPYGTAYFQKFAQNSALLKKVCDVGYDVDSVSYDKATGLIRYNRFTRAVDDDQLYAFHVELSYPDNTERIYKITKITEKPFQATELKFKNARETMLPIATYSTDDYYRRLVCKQLQLPEYAHLKQPGWGPIPLLDPPLYTDKLNMKRINGMLYCSLADTEDGLANLLFPSFAVRYDPQRKILEEADILYTDSWIPARTEYLAAIPYLDFLYHDGDLENP